MSRASTQSFGNFPGGPGTTTGVNLLQVGGVSFSLGQQLAVASLPVVLTAAQITTLTPPAAITGFALEAGNLASILTKLGDGSQITKLGDGSGSVVSIIGEGYTFADTKTGLILYGRETGTGASAVAHSLITNSAGELITQSKQNGTWNIGTVTTVSTVTNLSQLNGVAIAMNTGVRSTGTQRVTIATDDVVPVTGTFWQATQPVSGTIAFSNTTLAVTNTGTFAVQSTPVTQTDTFMLGGINIKEINAVAPLMGNGITGTGSQRVTIASDNTAFSVNATLSAETTKVIGTVNQGTSPWVVSGTVTANPTVPTVVQYGRSVIVLTGTAVQLASKAVSGVIVQAFSTNAASIYVGDVSVTSSNGFELQAGQATSVAIDNTNRLYINGTAGDSVRYIGS